jgi:hypothetical protein
MSRTYHLCVRLNILSLDVKDQLSSQSPSRLVQNRKDKRLSRCLNRHPDHLKREVKRKDDHPLDLVMIASNMIVAYWHGVKGLNRHINHHPGASRRVYNPGASRRVYNQIKHQRITVILLGLSESPSKT